MAFALYYPDRPILMFLLFPVPAKYFVMILGAIAFLTSPGGRVSNAAHLGGLVFGTSTCGAAAAESRRRSSTAT